MEQYLKVGVITSTHGIKGEVKVYPTTDDANRYKKLKEAYILFRNNYIKVTISSVKFFKNLVIVKFKDIDDINDVEQYRQCELYVDRADAVKLNVDEYFIADIIDSDVITDDGKLKGKLTDVLKTGANDVYEVTFDDGRVCLIPAIKECILDIDVENMVIKIHLLDGLMD